MTIQWSWFVPGVLLLLFPADRLLSSSVQLRSFDCFHSLENNGQRHRPWWWVPALWIDPFRAFFGLLLVKTALNLGVTRWALTPKPEYSLLIALMAVGILCQTLTRRGDHGVMLAPIGYAVGIVAALTPWTVAGLGAITGALGLFAFRQFHAFFAFSLVAVGILGFVLEVDASWVIPAVAALALPIVACMVSSSTLEIPVRNASGPVAPKLAAGLSVDRR